MGQRFGFVAMGLVLALVGASALAWRLAPTSLPDPALATRDELTRWLAVDLATQPPAIHEALVDRLQREVQTSGPADLGGTWDVPGPLPERYARRVAANAALLKRVWFTRRVDQYHVLPPAERPAFLDDQIQALHCWLEIESRLFESPDTEAAATNTVGQFLQAVTGWIEAAAPPAQARMQESVRAAVVRWLATCPLDRLSVSSQQELAHMLADQMTEQAIAPADWRSLTAEQCSRLAQNGERLARWRFRELALAFAELPAGEQPQFLEEQVKFCERCQSCLAGDSAEPRTGVSGSLSGLAQGWQFAKLTDAWLAESPPQERAALAKFRQALQAHVMARQLRALLPWPL